jgi:hypothetical protein
VSYLTDSCEQDGKIRIDQSGGNDPERKPHAFWRCNMRIILLAFFLITLAVPSYAAPKARDDASLARACRAIVGKEEPEATDGKSHIGQLNVQRYSDCLLGMPY